MNEKQNERTQRAIAALAAGEYKVTALETGYWSVVNGDNVPYRVSHETCECKDFANTFQLGLRCKHIEAIRILFPQGGHSSMNDNTPNPITGWTRLYHPAGAQVTVPILLDKPLSAANAQVMLDSVSAMLDAGWQVNAPGLEEGEQKQEVVSVSRREAKDGTPIIAFYLAHPKTVKKFLHSYLNKQEDVLAFEVATGLKLNAIPIWPGERDVDKDNKDSGKYIVPLPQPLNIVWEVNPKWQAWSAEGGKATGAIEPHKRILVRYDVATPKAPAPATGGLVRQYKDGSRVNGDSAEQVAFDAYLKAVGQSPENLESLRLWYRATSAKPQSTAA